MGKKAQVITADFVVGLALFMVVLVVTLNIIASITPENEYQILYNNAIYSTELLMTSGLPLNWNSSNVIIPGIITNQRLNITNLLEFDAINYNTTKPLLQTMSDYILFFENETNILNITKCVRGYPIQTDNNCEFNLSDIEYDHLVNIERYIIYDGKIIKMKIYAWR